jgi:hypothetical protein
LAEVLGISLAFWYNEYLADNIGFFKMAKRYSKKKIEKMARKAVMEKFGELQDQIKGITTEITKSKI